MKALSLATLCGLVGAGSLALAAEEATPAVTKVVLYNDAAMISRAVEAACSGPTTVARFPNLPPSLDPVTVRATASGKDVRVEGVSLVEQLCEVAYGDEVKTLDRQLEALAAKADALERRRQQAAENRARAQSLRASAIAFLSREAAAESEPALASWTAALDTTRATIEQAEAITRTADRELREVGRQQEELESRREALAGAAPQKAWEAEVVIVCPRGTSRVELSYVTLGAHWSPVYEARADVKGGVVALSVLAEVTQATAENWKGVEVTLSTASSRRDARPPKPQRLYVSSYAESDAKKVLVRRDEAASHLEGTSGAAPGTGGLDAADQGLSVQLQVPGRADLAGDGRPVRLLVETLKLPAKFGLVAIPKAIPLVFRSAEAKNVARYPLLAGRLDLFSGDSFLGTTRLARTGEGDRLRLAFGVDEKVKVKRVVVTEENKEPGLLGSTRTMNFAYRLELASYAAEAIELRVEEHVPVSELDDVKVTIDPATTSGYALVASDGLLSWAVPLKPGEKKNLDLEFNVEIPTKYEAGGL